MANDTGDFLTTLAARNGLSAGDVPPTVQPRLASRFEPPGSGAAAPADGDWSIVSDQAGAEERERRRAPPRESAPPRGVDDRSARMDSSRPARAEPPDTADQPAQAALRSIERWFTERETHTIRVIEREMARPAPAIAHPEQAATTAAPSQATRAVHPADGPRRGVEPARPAPSPRPPSPVRPSRPLAAPRAAAQPAQPDVHITIGRIDVRAAPAPANGRMPTPRPAAPSLERYLDSLGGDGGGGER